MEAAYRLMAHPIEHAYEELAVLAERFVRHLVLLKLLYEQLAALRRVGHHALARVIDDAEGLSLGIAFCLLGGRLHPRLLRLHLFLFCPLALLLCHHLGVLTLRLAFQSVEMRVAMVRLDRVAHRLAERQSANLTRKLRGPANL